MTQVTKTEFKFSPEELTYRWVAEFLSQWLVSLAEGTGSWPDHVFGNEEAFKDLVYEISDAFKRASADDGINYFLSPFVKEQLRDFVENFEHLWRYK